MGEKYTHIVFGVLQDELPECPNEDKSWAEYFYQKKDVLPKMVTSYQSDPEWIGIEIEVLSDYEVFEFDRNVIKEASAAWTKFIRYLETVEKLKVTGIGRLLIAHDE